MLLNSDFDPANSYLLLKHLHITCVVLSGSGFVARGLGVLLAAQWVNRRWAKTLPHIVDTGLLSAGIGMAYLSQQYPFAHTWLTAKFFALLAYIICGSFALKRGKTKGQKQLAFTLAVLCFAYLVSVAHAHQAWPW